MNEDRPEDAAPERPPDSQSPPAPDEAPATHGAAVELRAPAAELAQAGAYINGKTPQEIIATAKAIAEPLKELIEGAGLFANVGNGRKHVEIGGWQALGAMLGALGGQPLHAETIWTRPVRDPHTGELLRHTYTATVRRYHRRDQGGGLREETTYDVDGCSWEAKVEVRTAAGVLVGSAEGMCARDEETWNDRLDYALRSMAETRAESRAYRRAVGWLINLAGYNPTPAEEMGGGANGKYDNTAPEPPLPAWAKPAADSARKTLALQALSYMVDGNYRSPTAIAMLQQISAQFGGIPEVLVTAVSTWAGILQKRLAGEWEPPEAAKKACEPKADAPADAPAPHPVPDAPSPEPESDAPAPDDIPGGELATELITDAEVVAEPGSPPTPLEALHGEDDKSHMARLRKFGCVCKVPFAVNGLPIDQVDTCPLHGIPF